MKKRLFFLLLFCLPLLLHSCCQAETPVRKAEHVIMIGIDGWAAEGVRLAPAEDLPNIHALMDQGCWTLAKRSVMPSASAINWASMFNGLPTEMHGFDKWNSTRGTIPSTSDNGHGIPPTIFTILREQRPEAVSGCLYEWDGIGPLVDTLAMSWHLRRMANDPADEEPIGIADLTRIATDYIVAEKPELFALCYDFMDHAGHEHGWYGPEYMEHQKQLDAAIGQVIEALKEAGMYENSVIILSSDHGGTGRGHGSFTLLELETPLVVCGKGIRPGHRISRPLMQYDTPALIADILGLCIPDDWRGRPLPELFGTQ